jgi:hypothetical protein
VNTFHFITDQCRFEETIRRRDGGGHRTGAANDAVRRADLRKNKEK